MQGLKRVIIVVSLTVAQIALIGSGIQNEKNASSSYAQGSDYPNCRLGVGVVRNSINTYPITQMRLGWYMNWGAALTPTKPAGMDYYFTVRVKQDKIGEVYLPSYTTTPSLHSNPGGLGPAVAANPGQVWLIGNEPDRVHSQDDILPDMYARIYHDVYYFIKGIDPTAKVAIGAVVQPTPLRLQYLDIVLNTYTALYGTYMPVDVWNTHIHMIKEIKSAPGAEIPPGINATMGRQYTEVQHLDINEFRTLIYELRTWMKSRGYGNMPLIVSEFGALYPLWYLDDFGLTQGDINTFISNVYNFVNSEVNADLGYAADGNRLIQQAGLYSLDDDDQFTNPNPPEPLYRWGSFMFRSTAPYTLTATGQSFASMAATYPAAVDLLPYTTSTTPGSLISSGGQNVTATFKTNISNAGNTSPTLPVKVRFYDVSSGSAVQIGSDVNLSPFTGCGTLREASVTWPNLSPGLHQMRIQVDPASQIAELSESNNVLTATILVGSYGVYLPMTRR